MKVGGNREAKELFATQSAYNSNLTSLQHSYNFRAAAFYRDKINTEAQDKTWSIKTSSAQTHKWFYIYSSSTNNIDKSLEVQKFYLKKR